MPETNRSYSFLRTIEFFEDRYDYLRLTGVVAEETFGFDRFLNQSLYRSSRWLQIRDFVISRDEGCDLGIKDYPIFGSITVHHMNPIIVDDILDRLDYVLDPEFLICVSPATHKAIHYGNPDLLPKKFVERRPGDTILWRRK